MTLRTVFVGPNGTRAGWRLLLFFAILAPLGYGASMLIGPVIGSLQVDANSPAGGLATVAMLIAPLFFANFLMARMEGRRFGDYGLPRRGRLAAGSGREPRSV